MKKGSFLSITVPNPHRSSDRKTGVTIVVLQPGDKVVMAANFLAPNHDAAAFAIFLKELRRVRPKYVILPGRIFHDLAFQLMAPGAISDAVREETQPSGISDGVSKNLPLFPELVLQAKHSSEIWEERVIMLGKLLGEAILLRIVEAAGPQCHVFYPPALEGIHQNLPPESNIPDVLKAIQRQVDGFRHAGRPKKKKGKATKTHVPDPNTVDPAAEAAADAKADDAETDDDESSEKADVYPQIPMERQDFNQLLGVEKHPQIHVVGFGSAIQLFCLHTELTQQDWVNLRNLQATLRMQRRTAEIIPSVREFLAPKMFSEVRVEVGKRKVMNPIQECLTAVKLNQGSTIQAYPGQLSNAWISRFVTSRKRVYMFCCQLGMMFAREQMDFGDSALERYATGFYVGYNHRGFLKGKSFPFLRGESYRRSVAVYGMLYVEETPGGLGRGDVFIPLPDEQELEPEPLPSPEDPQ